MEQYIPKSAIVEEIERLKDFYNRFDDNIQPVTKSDVLDDVLSFLDTLEVKEEPVSEELEEAAHKYAYIRMSNYETAFYAFMSGAKWQKEQLMSKAVNGVEINSRRSDGRCILSGNFSRFDTGDKVKLIIIKQE